eukprot:CAMPEP_0175996322 /NCGR_PEP_ID=MMETSP0108-20121206/55606_1 /TAXON_ID=195067 ORGANISM="Goniomonas pacifica, Strain CCMP1869" /NCGR_SAMPLE_ID=MMETSP0108 /ASSEMBLY_ACC=CAM_ASM_000204 /LENGTH=49 /DNA_ID= /DNA_START= /DNA_END= /DNA_ORIENTATION=
MDCIVDTPELPSSFPTHRDLQWSVSFQVAVLQKLTTMKRSHNCKAPEGR